MKLKLINLLNKFFSFFNGELISKKDLIQYKLNLSNSINNLVDIEKNKYNDGLTCIVFSRNRAIQLYSLLESYQKFVKNPVDINVIYNASSKDHQSSYDELISMMKDLPFNLNLIKEKNSFRETLLDVFSKIKTKKIFFLTDDDIFIHDLNFDDFLQINPQNMIVSLRHNTQINYSYTADANFKPPKFNVYKENSNLNEFKWFESGYEWSDPWSVNGQIYLTAEVSVISKISSYKFPNSYENALKFFNFMMIGRKGLCFNESIIMNLPINIVQTEYKNLHGSLTADHLLAYWKKGFKLDIDILKNSKINSTHVNKAVNFKKR